MDARRGKRLKQIIDPTLAKAFTHPLRGHILVTLCEKGVASPKEVAEEAGLDVSEVSYHFRELKRRKLINLVRTEKRRGFAEHFYEPTSPVLFFDEEEWMRIPQRLRTTLSADMLGQVVRDLMAALEAGSFEARGRHLSRTLLTVDERGWEELSQVAEEALNQVLAIQKRCVKRNDGSMAKGGIPVAAVITFFETAMGSSTT